MTLKFNEELILYHIASGSLPLKEAFKRVERNDFSPHGQELFDTLLELHRNGVGITPESFVEGLRKRESLEPFGGPESVLDLIAIAKTISFEEEILVLKEKAVARRIAQLVQSDNHHEAIRLIRAELAKIPAETKKKIDMRWVSEMPTNYMEEEPPPKPQLLYWLDEKGLKNSFLHKEVVAMLVAAGGVGKTHLLAHLALCCITGIPFLGKFEFDSPGNVCLIVGENDEGDLHRLIRKARLSLDELLKENERRLECKKFGLHSPDPFDGAAKRLMPIHVHGMGAEAYFIGPDGNTTEFFNTLLALLKEKEPDKGWHLLILDPISRFAGLDAETDNALATAFISAAERLSLSLRGRPTIMLSHHKNKSATASSDSDQSAARGSSAFTDGCRWQANLDKGEDNSVTFHVVKTNFTSYSPKFRIKKTKDGSPVFDEFVEKEHKAQNSSGGKKTL